ncbi:MAG: helix-turn-helix domain-containing protein [Gammaproteobacteria bacterium]|nr:helix-turn-helix domain-containing protein [Gammaproteobacteria bacterium]
MNAQKKSSQPTTTSTSPAIKRNVYPYDVVNPGTRAENVLAIVAHVVYAPLPAGYREIDDVVRERENNPRHASALARARQRLAAQVEEVAQKTTVASLRLKAGLSQAKVAELLGNSQSSYSLIESGRRTDIFLSTFEKLADIFHVSRDELSASIKNTQEKAS